MKNVYNASTMNRHISMSIRITTADPTNSPEVIIIIRALVRYSSFRYGRTHRSITASVPSAGRRENMPKKSM